ncbi:transglutaminase-like domain-containing protein [Plebeiibacterium sediminum]|uniref:Transglutaminase-like domain-containing protein n=1 Tax=Plebeiibacterium sediminum TaxID=2992112 RepID=A0AAE3M7W1_9BACT|nr:transglutaminase-like domain-containing protein [Plebeiobacterium sediminum]MCW3788891.1 transglutaminase-like domain-containing protein [Plebeiobacterium sediminum]
MSNKSLFILLSLFAYLLMGCSNHHLEHDANKRTEINKQFLKQKELAKNRADELFAVFNRNINDVEKEALEFLYAYMPLSDLANYDQDFFLTQVRYALKTRTEFSWGKTVPDDLFLHFVLPYRINNEDMDSARVVFFKELKDRVKGMSMYDAALEVNHWCHEKVSYHPADIRTSGPLSTVRTALGRCGEESTFTVTALRAVGIPARQIYTPRWAHSDDNHAWVEVWADGEWYFLGACEPDPELDMGWFAGPATRAMLLHSRVFGDYTTTDDVVARTSKYTELNVIPDYAPTKRLYVKVKDPEGNAVQDANVEFQLYNYAEFYPLAKLNTNEDGVCSLLTGLGDLMIWAVKDDKIAFQKVTVANQDTFVVVINNYDAVIKSDEFALVPPVVGKIAEATDKGVQENVRRLHEEDSIRSAYESTFIDSLSVLKIAKEQDINNEKLQKIFKNSRGNWQVIKEFVNKYSSENKDRVVSLLSVIADKDRRDVRYQVLVDHFLNSDDSNSANIQEFNKYILNPRIKNELLTPYKEPFQSYFGKDFIQNTRADITVLLNWITDSITLVTDESTSRNPMFPVGVLELRVADKTSRDVFLVAALRSFGIPSRFDGARDVPQVLKKGVWNDLSFETLKVQQNPQGELVLDWVPQQKGQPQPNYYLQFTIEKFDGRRFNTLDYEYGKMFDSYPATLNVDAGKYLMVTGRRESNGTVWVKRTYFEVKEGETTHVPILFANPVEDSKTHNVVVDLKQQFQDLKTGKDISLLSLDQGEGCVVVWIDPDREPTKHLVNDLIRLKESYETWNGKIVLIVEPGKLTSGFKLENYKELPDNTIFLKDTKGVLSPFLDSVHKTNFEEYPMAFVITKKGVLVYDSSGYKIGAGDEILSKLNTYCRIH